MSSMVVVQQIFIKDFKQCETHVPKNYIKQKNTQIIYMYMRNMLRDTQDVAYESFPITMFDLDLSRFTLTYLSRKNHKYCEVNF